MFSRHNCRLLQEGLGCDVTFNGLYCHLLAHVLSFMYSCGDSDTLSTHHRSLIWQHFTSLGKLALNLLPLQTLWGHRDYKTIKSEQNKIKNLTTKLPFSNFLPQCELCIVQQPSSWGGETHEQSKPASFFYFLFLVIAVNIWYSKKDCWWIIQIISRVNPLLDKTFSSPSEKRHCFSNTIFFGDSFKYETYFWTALTQLIWLLVFVWASEES